VLSPQSLLMPQPRRLLSFSPRSGEKVAEGRMRGGSSHYAKRKPPFTQHQSSVALISVALTLHIKMLLKPDKNLANPVRFAKLGESIT
jgi:hypothetical protein